MEAIHADLAAQIIEEALSPTPMQNVERASRWAHVISYGVTVFL